MHHYVARSEHGPLFLTWVEGLELWLRLVAAFPELIALCVMPDHLHLILPGGDAVVRLGGAISGYARWRNHARGQSGPVWRPIAPPKPIPNDQHLRRTVRYVLLNPVRGGLCSDPISWPFSTHRDSVGFAFPTVVPRRLDSARFHAFVMRDGGHEPSLLPVTSFDRVDWAQVRDAVSAVCRAPVDRLRVRGPVRTLGARTAWAHGLRDLDLLGQATDLRRSALYGLVDGVRKLGAPTGDAALDACIRATGDLRFRPISGRVPLSDWRAWRDG